MTCLVRQGLQDVYEAALPELHRLATARDFGEVQRMLEKILSAHAQQDADGWLKRSIIAHKALLYMVEGDHGQALSTYQELKQLGFAQPSDRVEYSMGVSRAFLADGRALEAVAALEEALDSMDSSILPSGVPLLEALALGYIALDKSIPERWRDVLRSAALAAGIELPEREQDMVLDELIRFAADALRARSERGSGPTTP